jgi:hypothetical protein
MKTLTTKGYLELPDEEEMRSNGCGDVVVLENESGTVQVEMTVTEMEATGIDLDGDVVSDEIMNKVVLSLIAEGLLEQSI